MVGIRNLLQGNYPASITSASMCKDRKVKDNNKFTIHKGYMIQRICKTYNIRKYSKAVQTVITISTEPNTTPLEKRMSIPFYAIASMNTKMRSAVSKSKSRGTSKSYSQEKRY